MEEKKVYKCEKCDKIYKNYKSLWKHNHIYHRPEIGVKVRKSPIKVSQKVSQKVSDELEYPCRFCNKVYLHKQSRHSHEKKCKIINDNKQKELEAKANDAIKMKEKIENQDKKIEILIETVNTLKKEINKKNGAKTVNNNNNNGTIINNNIHINELGRENILNKLTLQEQINIATCHLFNESPHVEMVRLTYTKENCLENQNTLITNLQNKSCKVYNHKSKKFEATNKSQHIDNIIHYRKKDVEELSETLKNNKKVYKQYGKKLEPVEPINPEKDKEEITYIIYNNRGQVMQLKKELDKGNYAETEEDDEEEEDEDEEEEDEEEINEDKVKNITV